MLKKIQANRSEMTYARFVSMVPIFALGVVAASFAFGQVLNKMCPERLNHQVKVEKVLIIIR